MIPPESGSENFDVDAFDAAVGVLAGAKRVLALTGAGVSTASGIPDFRGPQGRWTQDPEAERISTLSWYLGDEVVRRKAWQARADSVALKAQPNPGHAALVALERSGRLAGLVTQNTDGLHLVAGNSPELVHEVHGNQRRWRCEDCGVEGPMAEMIARVHAGDTDPRCPECGGITRATVILFEETLDQETMQASIELARACDVVLAIGTSLTVYPVAGLVPLAAECGAKVVIINAEPTPFDSIADAVVNDPIQDVLPCLIAAAT
ncbi:NAD-dependent deacetylase [Arthrobacter sp. HMSC06H05]|uniref:SIR2 family NAD-dependent protein deacylase n=1 Tax=Arthrobacter sp. HMSC06H05 TaxID=1581128 RepID=UPI0008A258A2|nr:Sir2 family NAD-dependent protein deacetylase [Arthrobacter sp. HMSC06H05]OFT43851.1 NAD-dependent deacetylase [Arthrobacter sp. HMSC06H05]